MKNLLNRKKLLLIAAVTILIAGGSFLAYSLLRNDGPTNPSVDETATNAEKGVGPSQTTEKGVKQNEERVTDNNSEGSLSISAAYYDSQSRKAIVKAVVNNNTDGTCKTTFSKRGYKSLTITSKVSIVTSYYSCGAMNMDRDSFSASGDWSVKTELISKGGVSVSEDTDKINVQ